jgi:hypothetical protein
VGGFAGGSYRLTYLACSCRSHNEDSKLRHRCGGGIEVNRQRIYAMTSAAGQWRVIREARLRKFLITIRKAEQ